MPEARLLGTRALVPKGVIKKTTFSWLNHQLNEMINQLINVANTNAIKHRKTIQTSVVKANLASKCLPDAVWVVIRCHDKLFATFGRFTSCRRLTGVSKRL